MKLFDLKQHQLSDEMNTLKFLGNVMDDRFENAAVLNVTWLNLQAQFELKTVITSIVGGFHLDYGSEEGK